MGVEGSICAKKNNKLTYFKNKYTKGTFHLTWTQNNWSKWQKRKFCSKNGKVHPKM